MMMTNKLLVLATKKTRVRDILFYVIAGFILFTICGFLFDAIDRMRI